MKLVLEKMISCVLHPYFFPIISTLLLNLPKVPERAPMWPFISPSNFVKFLDMFNSYALIIYIQHNISKNCQKKTLHTNIPNIVLRAMTNNVSSSYNTIVLVYVFFLMRARTPNRHLNTKTSVKTSR